MPTRSAILEAIDGLGAVLRLHKPRPTGPGRPDLVCQEDAQGWPCATVRVVAEASPFFDRVVRDALEAARRPR